MKSIVRSAALVLVVMAALAAPRTWAQQPQYSEEQIRLIQQIRKQIVTLSNYGVFDNITFGIAFKPDGAMVKLMGQASRPTLKKSSEKVISKLEGVKEVINEIEVLPTSRMDEDIRFQVYAKIYYHPTLSRYNPNRGAPPFGGGYGGSRRYQQGISLDPPMGMHPMHIIVKNGNVTLVGVVDTEGDKTIAQMQANTVSGVFAVTNELAVVGGDKKKKKKKDKKKEG